METADNMTVILTPDERQAMRAILQRAEVRLSTMHRIAGVFINGAGLLVLFPLLFRDSVKDIFIYLSSGTLRNLLVLDSLRLPDVLTFVSYISVVFAFVVSLAIPIYALLLLIQDLVYFYFVGNSPGASKEIVHPRLSLTGLTFPIDEGENAKKEILRLQYSTDIVNFILPFDRNKAKYYDEINFKTKGKIIPSTRTLEELRLQGVFENLPGKKHDEDILRFNVALGMAGVFDRTLIGEVAKMEASIARHALYLRRLVLRYIKALLAFIWTTLFSFGLVALLIAFRDWSTTFIPEEIALALEQSQIINTEVVEAIISTSVIPSKLAVTTALLISGLAYIIWGFAMVLVVKRPIKWIKSLSSQDGEDIRDPDLLSFEELVVKLCNFSSLSAFIALVCSVIALFLLI
jgi:hypothetical protein